MFSSRQPGRGRRAPRSGPAHPGRRSRDDATLCRSTCVWEPIHPLPVCPERRKSILARDLCEDWTRLVQLPTRITSHWFTTFACLEVVQKNLSSAEGGSVPRNQLHVNDNKCSRSVARDLPVASPQPSLMCGRLPRAARSRRQRPRATTCDALTTREDVRMLSCPCIRAIPLASAVTIRSSHVRTASTMNYETISLQWGIPAAISP